MHITTQSILSALCFLGVIAADSLLSSAPNSPVNPQPDAINGALHQVPTGAPPMTQAPSNPLTAVKRPKHSQCYNYFLEKDGCVNSAAKTSERCPDHKCGRTPPADVPRKFNAHQQSSSSKLLGLSLTGEGLKASILKSEQASNGVSNLVRRYDSESDSFPIAGGNGICGDYTTDQPGVCLWTSGLDSGAAGSGWLNGTFTKACGRMVFIQRQGDPDHTTYAPVVDGCTFNVNTTEPGCFNIAFTEKTFNDLNPSADEKTSSIMNDLVWDFINIHGDKPRDAAP